LSIVTVLHDESIVPCVSNKRRRGAASGLTFPSSVVR